MDGTINRADREDGSKGAGEGSEGGKDRSSGFLRRLTVSEWLTFLVGFGSLIVSYLTYLNAADTQDLKVAVGRLTDLAAQTRREADLAVDANADIRSIANETNSRTDREIRISQKTADAAVGGVHQQEQEFRIDERPIVSAWDQLGSTHPILDVPYIDPVSHKLGWNFILKNYGKSTATDVTIHCLMNVQGGRSVNACRFSKGDFEMVPSSIFWGSILWPHVLPIETSRAIIEQHQFIIIEVLVKYKDIFGFSYEAFICHAMGLNGSIGSCITPEYERRRLENDKD